MRHAIKKQPESPSLLRIWAQHCDLLPRYDYWLRQRVDHGAWCCPSCGIPFFSDEDWKSKTELVERYTLIPGGKIRERRRCICGGAYSLPIKEREEKHAS